MPLTKAPYAQYAEFLSKNHRPVTQARPDA